MAYCSSTKAERHIFNAPLSQASYVLELLDFPNSECLLWPQSQVMSRQHAGSEQRK
jgi:hypothetical protein